MDNKIILETISGMNLQRSYKYYKRNTILSFVALGISFLCMIIGSLVAAIWQIWGMFTLTGIGLIGIVVSSLFVSWHLLRFQNAQRIKRLIQEIEQKNCHTILSLARIIKCDQQGMLYLLRHLQKNDTLLDYEIVDDVLFAKKELKLTDYDVKKMSQSTQLGRIRYQQTVLLCEKCHCQFDYSLFSCPYCGMKISNVIRKG